MIANRRLFCGTLAFGLSGVLTNQSHGSVAPKLKIGYTGINWNVYPGDQGSANLGPALKDIAALGFDGFETFPEILEDLDARQQLQPLLDQYGVPLTSGYIRMNLTDPAARKQSVAQAVRLARVILRHGGRFAVLAPQAVDRKNYDFRAAQGNIIEALNDHAMAVNDAGLETGLHQHTGTSIETRDEVYYVMHAADTKHLKFAPDVGQLQKGGSDAEQVVKDFLPLVRHMHLKDFNGGEDYLGYCPLGRGKVKIPQILDLLEQGSPNTNVMIELDGTAHMPMPPLESARISKAYLVSLGYTFRT